MSLFGGLKKLVGKAAGGIMGVSGVMLGMGASALGIGKTPKIGKVDPAAERAAAETAAAQQAMAATSLKRRLRRASLLTAAGSTKTAAAPQLSSVLSYGKTMTGE